MGVYIKNITKDDLAENGALMWGKRIIFIPPEDIIPVQDHGDLIDRDVLMHNMVEIIPRKVFDFVPVIITAERSEDG